jgi:hypothetical protein
VYDWKWEVAKVEAMRIVHWIREINAPILSANLVNVVAGVGIRNSRDHEDNALG